MNDTQRLNCVLGTLLIIAVLLAYLVFDPARRTIGRFQPIDTRGLVLDTTTGHECGPRMVEGEYQLRCR